MKLASLEPELAGVPGTVSVWCGPLGVNLKRGDEVVGHYAYDAVLDRARALLDEVIRERGAAIATP